MPIFTVEAAMTEEDYRWFNRQHRRRVTRGQYLMQNLCAALLLIGGVFFATQGQWGYFALFFAVGAGYFVFCRVYEQRAIKRMVASGKLPLNITARYRFYRDSMEEESTDGAVRSLRYQDAWGVSWDERAVYLYLDKATAYILPRSGVAGGRDKEMEAFLGQRVTRKGRKAP